MTKTLRLALVPGDGIGAEVIPAAQRVLDALHLPIEYVLLEAGWGAFEKCGAALPDVTVSALQTCHGALFGAVSSPSHRVEGYDSPILTLRKHFDLYANLRPVVSSPTPGSRPNVDLLIVRENTECLYVKQESLEEGGERAVAQRVITRRASQRIANMAFTQSRSRHALRNTVSDPKLGLIKRSPLVTVVHKANVLSVTDGLFRESALAVAKAYGEIQVEEQLVDSMVYRLIREPERYDVVVAPNLYGDIISDAAAALVGGLGIAPSANVGDSFVVAEPVHGSAPDIAGRGTANPVAAILASGLLLQTLGRMAAAAHVQQAVDTVLRNGVWTPDLGGVATTDEVTKAVIGEIRRLSG